MNLFITAISIPCHPQALFLHLEDDAHISLREGLLPELIAKVWVINP